MSKIAQWNVDGLLQHKQEIEFFLRHNEIDILLISETHFANKSYFNIANYTTYCTNYPDQTVHAGTPVIIKIKLYRFELPKYELDHLLYFYHLS